MPVQPDEVDGVEMTGHEIYRRIQDGPGTVTLNQAARVAALLVARYALRRARITAIRDRMVAAWHGSAGDAAQSVMSPLTQVFEETLGELETAGKALAAQSARYWETFHGVQEIPKNYRMPSHPYSDVSQVIEDYNTKAENNVRVYQQYVAQSRANAEAMPRSFPTVSLLTVPPVTVRGAAGQAGIGSSTEPGNPSTVAPGGGDRWTDPTLESQPDDPSGESQPDDRVAPLPPGDTATGQQGWGPDPSLARQLIGDTTPSSAPAVLKGPDGPGMAALGGTAGNPDTPDRDGQGRRPGSALWARASGDVPYRAVLRPAAPPGTGGAFGGAMSPLTRGRSDDTEHTPRYGRYVDPNELFASDVPVSSPVIGAEDDEEGEDDR
jgi:hypothetical protein